MGWMRVYGREMETSRGKDGSGGWWWATTMYTRIRRIACTGRMDAASDLARARVWDRCVGEGDILHVVDRMRVGLCMVVSLR